MSENKAPSPKRVMRRLMKYISNYLIIGLVILILVFGYGDYREYGFDLARWDMMFISGFSVFTVAVYLARTTPDRVEQMIDRLVARGTLELSNDNLVSFKNKLFNRARRFSNISAIVVGLLILGAFAWAFGEHLIMSRISFSILATFLGLVAGYYVGQMIAFGTLGQLVRKEEIPVVSIPGHIDQAAGLKPIGSFYFYQAMILAIACAYFAVWWFIIPIFPRGYDIWLGPYLMLLIVALAIEILSFFIPMWRFHQIMREQKNMYLKEADGLSEEIIKLEEFMMKAEDRSNFRDVQKQLDFLREKYWQIENMPTWPVDAKIRRRFTTNNLLLSLPFVFDLIKTTTLTDILEKIIEYLTKLNPNLII